MHFLINNFIMLLISKWRGKSHLPHLTATRPFLSPTHIHSPVEIKNTLIVSSVKLTAHAHNTPNATATNCPASYLKKKNPQPSSCWWRWPQFALAKLPMYLHNFLVSQVLKRLFYRCSLRAHIPHTYTLQWYKSFRVIHSWKKMHQSA